MISVKHLLIIGGPSCSGKSTLIDKIKNGKCPQVGKELLGSSPLSWTFVDACQLPEIQEQVVDRLALHYDFYWQYNENGTYNYLPDLLSKTENVSVLTLCTPSKYLILRNAVRIVKQSVLSICSRGMPGNRFTGLKDALQRQRVYRNKEKILDFYTRWFDYISSHRLVEHKLIDSGRLEYPSCFDFNFKKFMDIHIR